ncbi:hypothetical protein AT05_11825 [Schleiferia thermophila str. Yellowstone]|uniref:hypothetical protein n=1 Tax=Schleiferia thermophila TaxID=884107 RepID=UPI0004E77F15|nr:hypothetical protein [Schleiferia thermophila]KFD38102.1 hypothetical protein AT05_11825 [Schleiferia thermophila str. Yellowstone]
MRKAYSIIAMAFTIILSSCGDEDVKFYKQHSDNLEKLAVLIASDATITDACCIKDRCFNPQALELMQKLNLECLRKDTSDGTVNFILGNRGKKLESTEIVYLYQRELGEPKEYLKAGISIKKVNANWFVRKYGFD